jgi:hypothetical protein
VLPQHPTSHSPVVGRHDGCSLMAKLDKVLPCDELSYACTSSAFRQALVRTRVQVQFPSSSHYCCPSLLPQLLLLLLPAAHLHPHPHPPPAPQPTPTVADQHSYCHRLMPLLLPLPSLLPLPCACVLCLFFTPTVADQHGHLHQPGRHNLE